jgi:hypothetical protein
VNNAGIIYSNALNNAAKVAWLLTNYGTGGQGDQAKALQAAIWTVIYGNSVYRLDTSNDGRNSSNVISLYNTMLIALDSHTGNVSDFLWISPKYSLNGPYYQGLVGTTVPIPAAVWLLGSGLIGLIGIRRFRK